MGMAMAFGKFHGVASAAYQARIACLLVADFPLAAIVRANPELRDRPCALIRTAHGTGCAPHSELSQVSAPAQALGVRPTMTVAQARALIPDLAILNPSPAAERAAADALLDVAESISPIVEEGAPGCVWLDLTGSSRFYRPPSGQSEDPRETYDTQEESIADELVRRARRIGLEAAVGIATGKEIARLAARCGGARVIEAGREREFLDWMPLDLLDLGRNARGDDLELVLKRLGIRRLGELARLDARAVGSRLGNRGAELMRLARGDDSARLAMRPRTEVFSEALDLEYGIETIEPLAFVMRAMLAHLTERLRMRGLVAGDIALALGLADRRRDDRRVPVAAPTLEVRALLTLVTLHLEASPPPAPVESIRLTLEARSARPAQADMFLPPAPAPDRLEAALARLAALCGPDHVGRLEAAQSYRPEATRLRRFEPAPAAPPPGAPAPAAAHVVPIVMRTLRPAQPVEVMCSRETPEFVRGENVCARVVSAAGPWRRQGEWWASARGDDAAVGADSAAPDAYARDYYDLALADGGVYRVYRELNSAQWFIDGLYD